MDRRKFMGLATMAGISVASTGGDLIASDARELNARVRASKSLLDAAQANGKALRREAEAVFKRNRVDSEIGVFHLPSAETYRSFFAWDSGWNVISLMHLDPELAYQELHTIFNVQCEDGHVPHEVRVPELKETEFLRKVVIWAVRNQYDGQGRSCFIDPPSFLIAGGLLFERTEDERILELLPAMEKCAEYLTGPRDLFGDGLVSIIHPWESGTDSAPVFDTPMGINMKNPLVTLDYLIKYPGLLNHNARLGWDLDRIAGSNRFVMEDVGINAITAAGLAALGYLFNRSGDGKKALKWRSRSRSMVETMEELMWDEKAGFFYPRYNLEKRLRSKRTCLTGLLPLITGGISEDRAHRVIDEYLMSDKHFRADWLVPFNSVSELAGERIPLEDMMLWRGHCIWINMNWMAARAASLYGRDEVAQEITKRTVELVLQEGFREFYDWRTGEGGGAAGFTWPGLVLDMVDRWYKSR